MNLHTNISFKMKLPLFCRTEYMFVKNVQRIKNNSYLYWIARYRNTAILYILIRIPCLYEYPLRVFPLLRDFSFALFL